MMENRNIEACPWSEKHKRRGVSMGVRTLP